MELKKTSSIVYGLAVKNSSFKNKNDKINNDLINPEQKVIIPNNNEIIERRKGLSINNNGDSYSNSIIKYFTKAPQIGLSNIGSTCYMNATLQCFCQIEEFASFFKYDNYVNTISTKYSNLSKDCLTSSFKILIEKLWPSNFSYERYYKPVEFRKKIARMSPLFEKMEANDAKDLVNFIIMTLHEELNRSLQTSNNYNYSPNNVKINQIEIFNDFYQEYIKAFRSKISDIFYAIQETQTKCLNCKFVQYNYQAYFFLVFPLDEVKKYAINKTQIHNQSNNIFNNNVNINMNAANNVVFNNVNNVNMKYNFNFNINNFPQNMNNNINNNITNNNMNFNNNIQGFNYGMNNSNNNMNNKSNMAYNNMMNNGNIVNNGNMMNNNGNIMNNNSNMMNNNDE